MSSPIVWCEAQVPGAVLDKRFSEGRQSSQHSRFGIGNPNCRQEIATKELCENHRINLVGLDFCIGNRLGFHGIANDDLGDVGFENIDHTPSICRCFQGDVILWGKGLRRKPLENRLFAYNATAIDLFSGGIKDAVFVPSPVYPLN